MGLNLGEKSIFSDLGDVDCTSGGDPFALIAEAVSFETRVTLSYNAFAKKGFLSLHLGQAQSMTVSRRFLPSRLKDA